MENANNFFNDLENGLSKGLNVAKLAKVVKFYPEHMKVDVIPYPTKDSAIILNVPIATINTKEYLVYYPLKADDIVVLLFIDFDTDNILLGEDSIETDRGHDLSDCVCIGSISTFKETLKPDDINSLVIQDKANIAKIKLNSDGVEIEAPKINLKGMATYKGKEIAVKGDSVSIDNRII
nr:MAG TPA_asm: baseplate protein [Caudoviricetes sp.]